VISLQSIGDSQKQVLSPPHVYTTIVRRLPTGFFDEAGAIFEFNPAVEEIAGHMKPEVVGRTHLAIPHGSSAPKACSVF
jgi:PAS domain S-box-containing protein